MPSQSRGLFKLSISPHCLQTAASSFKNMDRSRHKKDNVTDRAAPQLLTVKHLIILCGMNSTVWGCFETKSDFSVSARLQHFLARGLLFG